MEYRHMGASGIRLSVLSFGSWVTFANQLDVGRATECMAAAYESGISFFDNAQVYAGGRSEEVMGRALAQLGWRRSSYLISTKFFWGHHDGPNEKDTLNRKFLLEGIDGSLERLGLDHVDIVYCHRPDPTTPVEETVWAMSDIVSQGKAFYWGTSEWPVASIRAAHEIAERHHLHKPRVEQPQYHLLHRENVEQNLAPLCDELGLGLTTFSPLASGLLTGKYNAEIPQDSRLALAGMSWLKKELTPELVAKLRRLEPIAADLGCTLAQLAIAWCAINPNVTSVITGASRPEQVRENVGALDVMGSLTTDVLRRIDAAISSD